MNFIAQDIEMASFPRSKFDFILCSNGMAYLQHPHATLKKFRVWLCEGGKLCFNTPLVRQPHYPNPLPCLANAKVIKAG